MSLTLHENAVAHFEDFQVKTRSTRMKMRVFFFFYCAALISGLHELLYFGVDSLILCENTFVSAQLDNHKGHMCRLKLRHVQSSVIGLLSGFSLRNLSKRT